jgi:surface protein
VSSCESFYKIFGNCYLFNQPLGKWNTSKVRDVCYMFSMCASFKGDLNSWDISNLKLMICLVAVIAPFLAGIIK